MLHLLRLCSVTSGGTMERIAGAAGTLLCCSPFIAFYWRGWTMHFYYMEGSLPAAPVRARRALQDHGSRCLVDGALALTGLWLALCSTHGAWWRFVKKTKFLRLATSVSSRPVSLVTCVPPCRCGTAQISGRLPEQILFRSSSLISLHCSPRSFSNPSTNSSVVGFLCVASVRGIFALR